MSVSPVKSKSCATGLVLGRLAKEGTRLETSPRPEEDLMARCWGFFEPGNRIETTHGVGA